MTRCRKSLSELLKWIVLAGRRRVSHGQTDRVELREPALTVRPGQLSARRKGSVGEVAQGVRPNAARPVNDVPINERSHTIQLFHWFRIN